MSCKLLESLINYSMVDHIILCTLHTDSQHGIDAKRSCDTELFEVTEDVTNVNEKIARVDVLYLDIKKQFSHFHITKSLGRLTTYGIMEKLLKCINDFIIRER